MTIALELCIAYSAYSIEVDMQTIAMQNLGDAAMVTVKSSQKIFTDTEVATLTGICLEHLRNFAKSRHLGFIARAAEAAGLQADQWLFTPSDLMVLVTLFPRCTH
jgi:hypothetical protein